MGRGGRAVARAGEPSGCALRSRGHGGCGRGRPDDKLGTSPQQAVPITGAVPSAGEGAAANHRRALDRSEEHTSVLQALMRISYAVFCLKKINPALAELLTPHPTPTT